MKQFRRSLLVLPAALIVVGAAAPAMAHSARADAAGGNGAASSGVSDHHIVGDNVGSPLQDHSKSRANGQAILQELIKGHQRHTAAQRQKNCQAAKEGLERKLSNLQTNSQKYLDRVNDVLQKTSAYQTASNLNPDGFDGLAAKAAAAKVEATASLSNLQNLSVNLDCSSDTVATTVANFKAAAQNTRSDLLAYRNAVKNMIVALLQVKGGGNNGQ